MAWSIVFISVDNGRGVRLRILRPNTRNLLLEVWSAKMLQFGRFRAANRFSAVPCQPVDDAVFANFIGRYNCNEAGSSVSHDYLTAHSHRLCFPGFTRHHNSPDSRHAQAYPGGTGGWTGRSTVERRRGHRRILAGMVVLPIRCHILWPAVDVRRCWPPVRCGCCSDRLAVDSAFWLAWRRRLSGGR